MKRKLNLSIFFLCFLFALHSKAQPLNELSRASEFRDATRTNLKALPFPAWLNPKSNYVALFSVMSPEQFSKKFINLPEGFTQVKLKRHRALDYVSFSAEFYKTTRKNPIELTVFMPHPSVFELAENSTLPSLLELTPRPSSIVESSLIDIQGHEASVLQLSDTSFVMMLRLPMQVRIFVKSQQQAYLSQAREILEHSNMQWLVEQLSS